ncbi:hypothetical protein [Kamptonema formosum]|uniref:hypothetical protein n=1 Tax=Kamptonema formosum TaxID=331992 RepID=UPI000346B779|nr:hypothetical protein [Oscillatoria sp. PCC 10802]
MSYFLRVFCQSAQLFPCNEIADFIQDGCFFDEKPRFEIRQGAADAGETDWQSITVHYQTGQRPVIIERNLSDNLLQQEVSEIIEILKSSGHLNQHPDLVRTLAGSQQVIAIEIDPVGLTDAGWEMLDCLEAHLASSLSGIIYAPNQGFYDRNLQPLYTFDGKFPQSASSNSELANV